MTHEELIRKIEGYYGPYCKKETIISPIKKETRTVYTGYPERKAAVLSFLEQRVPEYCLDLVYGKITSTVSSKFSHKPDVVDFRSAIDSLEQEGRFAARENELRRNLDRKQLEERRVSAEEAKAYFDAIHQIVGKASEMKRVSK